jgi:hypothetical protein
VCVQQAAIVHGLVARAPPLATRRREKAAQLIREVSQKGNSTCICVRKHRRAIDGGPWSKNRYPPEVGNVMVFCRDC